MKNTEHIHDTGNLRHSHAPMQLVQYGKREKPQTGMLHHIKSDVQQRTLSVFLKDLEEKTDEAGGVIENLSDAEVHEKCFQVLGYLEEFQRVAGKEMSETAERNITIEAIETEDDLLRLLTEEDAEAKVHTDLDLPEALPAPEAEDSNTSKKQPLSAYRKQIIQKVRDLLGYRQVRELFLGELMREAEKYQRARPKLDVVAKMEFAEAGALRKIIEIYLDSKRTHGKLVQSASDNIRKLEDMKRRVSAKAQTERHTADQEEQGFLVAQKLLQYKQQIRTKGFAMTPSRREMVEKISEHVLAGRKVFLVGSTGTGKTELALYVSDAVSGNHEIISWHEGTTPRDLFGYRELWTNEAGQTVSGTKPGPVTKAVSDGAVAIHDEYTAGTTRSQIAAKAFMNAKPGQHIHIPGFNGDVFEVSSQFAEIFTGNPKDERTKAREDMDPAILRMLTGLKTEYMPASEMKDIILANIIEDNGVLRLNHSEVELIEKLCNAATVMHMFHDRVFKGMNDGNAKTRGGFDDTALTKLKQPFGTLEDSRLDKNFLDPGTLFSLFADFDLSRARQGDLKSHLEKRLRDFLSDPKFDTVPEERVLAANILEITGVIRSASHKDVQVQMPAGDENDYILPSQLANGKVEKRDHDDLGGTDEADAGAPDSGEDHQALEAELEHISEGRYLSPEKLNDLLQTHLGCKIPSREIKRLRALLPSELSPENRAKLEKLKNATEDEAPPLIQQIPSVFEVDGEEKPFTIANLQEVWNTAKANDVTLHGMFLSNLVKQETKDKVWDGKLRAYTSKCLKDSKGIDYDAQLAHQEAVLGENSEIDADMYLAMLFRYLASNKAERLMLQDFMRLNGRDTDGDSLCVYSGDADLRLGGSTRGAVSHSGVGGSLEIGKIN